MKRNWTKEQSDAINALSGSVLVSAAAGSGKTAVLVERIIKRITEGKNPTSIDRLLVVTFTKAAAGEMKQRIAAAVEEKIRENPTDSHLLTQRMLLPSAKICTIDSFCGSLVKENFQMLDISPDYSIADEGQIEIVRSDAAEMTLEMLYEKGEESFLNLVELLFKGRDDSYLLSVIYDLYDASVSYPFPEAWLDEVSGLYENVENAKDSRYGKIVLDYVKRAIDYCIAIDETALEIISSSDAYTPLKGAFQSDMDAFSDIRRCAETGDFDAVKRSIDSYSPARMGSVKKENKGEKYVEYLKTVRGETKDVVRKELSSIVCCNEKEYIEDMKALCPMVKALCDATKLFYKNFSDLKREKNIADFNDVAHMALSLLVKLDENGSTVQTELAKTIAENFDEILIDEYQDTNKAQDMLFTSISRNNLFRVGDVKQSIYSFRRAMPEIFISLKEQYPLYDREKQNHPSKIVLGNNFRSRASVTGAVNFLFSSLMSKDVGGVDYTDEERLVFSAAYDEHPNDCAELHVIRDEIIDKSAQSSSEYQAAYIADMISKMVEDGYTVKDGDGHRKVNYGDFCILLRAVNGETGAAFVKALKDVGIPCYAEVSTSLLSAYEVSLVLSLLRIIDNPKQDIPLMTVLMSALFGFTADDLANIRLKDRKADLYSCLVLSKDEPKVKAFLDKIFYYRSLSVSMGTEDFIRMIYDDTSIDVIVCSMKNSSAKMANLQLILNYASVYERSGYIGLSGFIGFVDRLERNKTDLKGSIGVIGEANVVKIMSIHKSKGLEFPICILANCSKHFNRRDEANNVVISNKNGIGVVARDTETMAQYKTLSHTAVKLTMKSDSISEEMRVLYVAMTRAKEKLIMVGICKNMEKKLLKLSSKIGISKRIKPFSVLSCSSYFDWILTAFLRHRDAEKLRSIAGLDEDIVVDSDFSLKVVIEDEQRNEPVAETKPENKPSEISSELMKLLKKRCDYRYEYEQLSLAVSKRAASQVDENAIDSEYFASSKPAFMTDDGLTAAQKGTATHLFMQYADYERAAQDVEKELERITKLCFITETEAKAINVRALKKFFSGSLYQRIAKSPLVMREKKFTVSIPIGEVYSELSQFEGERVLLQGIADCAFVENGKLVVVDYKTDSLQNEEDFIRKYSSQVNFYKKALEMCTEYEVCETLLYSFKLGKEIRIFF